MARLPFHHLFAILLSSTAVLATAGSSTTTTCTTITSTPTPFPEGVSSSSSSSASSTSTGSPPGQTHIPPNTLGAVHLSTGHNFTGSEWRGVWPIDKCIDLNGYAGKIRSFRPENGTECNIMQGRCNGDVPYVGLYHNSTYYGELGHYDFIDEVTSYFCTPAGTFFG